MNKSEKIEYFDSHIIELITHNENDRISFLKEVVNLNEVQNQIKDWPDEIKETIVDKFLA